MKTTNRITLTTLAALLCLSPALTRAETAVQAWVQRYNGPGNGDDWVKAVAVDGSNNVIVTGNSTPGCTTIKYSSAGVPLWTNRYNMLYTASVAHTQALAVDGSNNVIVTGSSWNGTNNDYAIIKYSSAGDPLWTNICNILHPYTDPDDPTNIFFYSGDDQPVAVAVDHSNNVIVTGNSTRYRYGDYASYATVKYSSAGVPLWTNLYEGYTPDGFETQLTAIAVDGSNNVIVTGCLEDTSFWPGYMTIKYSDEGALLWTNRYWGQFYCAFAVAVDGSNNVVVTGGAPGRTTDYDFATIKYSSEGVPLWTNRYNGPSNGVDYANALAVDHDNNVIVTGNSGTDYNHPFDYATIKYSSAGVPLWTNRYNGPGNGNDWPWAVAVDSSNNVIVTGYSTNSTSGYDYATIKYSSAGVPLWTARYNGPGNGNDVAKALAVDHSDNVIVTGWSTNNASGYDFATIKYICVPSPVLTGLQLADGTVQLRVDEVLQPGTLVIEASTNLAGWAAVFTNSAPTNVLFYADPEAGSHRWRFYRAFQFP